MYFLVASVKADQVFLPVLENAAKAQKLRTTLGVFERSKFFFNLPGSIMEAIEAVGVNLSADYDDSYIGLGKIWGGYAWLQEG